MPNRRRPWLDVMLPSSVHHLLPREMCQQIITHVRPAVGADAKIEKQGHNRERAQGATPESLRTTKPNHVSSYEIYREKERDVTGISGVWEEGKGKEVHGKEKRG